MSIKEDFMVDLAAEATQLLGKDMISRKSLRSFTGKCNHVANLLYGWRPFYGPTVGRHMRIASQENVGAKGDDMDCPSQEQHILDTSLLEFFPGATY